MRVCFILISIMFFYSCNNTKEDSVSGSNSDNLEHENKIVVKEELKNDEAYDCYNLSKNSICGVEIGMNMDSSLQVLVKKSSKFQFADVSSNEWGYGGASRSKLVKKNSKNHFVLIPSLVDNNLKFIIVLNKKFKTSKGLHVGQSIKDLLNIYPDLKVTVNLMNGYEEAKTDDGFTLVFLTTEKSRIGIYEEIESYSSPVNLDHTLDRIVISAAE